MGLFKASTHKFFSNIFTLLSENEGSKDKMGREYLRQFPWNLNELEEVQDLILYCAVGPFALPMYKLVLYFLFSKNMKFVALELTMKSCICSGT